MKRIRRKGLYDRTWEENLNAVYVGRPSKWGNPFKVGDYGRVECLRLYEAWLKKQLREDPSFLRELAGKDLVCWCPLDKSCHADILIKHVMMKGLKT